MTGTKRLAAVALGLALLSACIKQPSGEITPYVPPPSTGQPSTATPSTATASPTTTPTPTVTPTQTKAELLAEAEKTYRAYVVETLKLEAVGGADELPEGVAIYLEEPYKGVVKDSYVRAKKTGSKVTGTENVTVEAVAPIDESDRPGAIVAISACLDASKAVITRVDGSTRPGSSVSRTRYFKRSTNGSLVIFDSEAKAVEQC